MRCGDRGGVPSIDTSSDSPKVSSSFVTCKPSNLVELLMTHSAVADVIASCSYRADTTVCLREILPLFYEYNTILIQSDLGSRTPRIVNNAVYEQIFRTKSVSDDILCLELRTRKPSTSWNDKLGVSVFHFLTTSHLRRQLSSI